MRARILATVLCGTLVAVSCGSDSDVTTGTTTVSPTTTTEPAEPNDTVSFEPSAGVERAEIIEDAVPELVAAINEAGFDLLVSQDVAENSVLSPTSIVHAVLMARAAADEPTASAIDASLTLPVGLEGHEAWNALDFVIAESNATATAIDDSPTPIVTIADRIWPSFDAEPDQDWLDLLARYHGADVEPIDVMDPDGSRARINGWVSDQTAELIPELLPAGFIKPNTKLVLTDAVYFKAQWRTIFGKYGEVTGSFELLDGSTVDVSFLRQLELPGPRGFGEGYAAAELPYLGDAYSMLLVIPQEGRFEEIRERLSNDFLAAIDTELTEGPYELLMPEWATTTALDLLPWLTDVGAAPGHYPGIGPGVFLDSAVHGADIAVDDIGTVAAAATALGFAESGPPEPEFTIAADKPFLYVLRHVDSGLVLFAGQVTDPTS